jgi:pSer/pThr/pTyr-binding forkhead associated (FHA) protein
MAGKLILSLDGAVVGEFPLGKERITIGRKPHNDIQIDNLAVSGEHAAVITILNDSFMEDLGSTNGTLVNGQMVKKHFLQNGDVIELGKHKLKYLNDTPSETTAEDFEKTMVMRRPVVAAPVAQPREPSLRDTLVGMRGAATATATRNPMQARPAPVAAVPSPAPAAAPQSPPNAAIQVLSGGAAGKVLELTKTLTTLGKPGVQVAVITRRPSGFFITHVEGASFPVLNGTTLSAQAHALKDHDIIEIAGVKMEFFLHPVA